MSTIHHKPSTTPWIPLTKTPKIIKISTISKTPNPLIQKIPNLFFPSAFCTSIYHLEALICRHNQSFSMSSEEIDIPRPPEGDDGLENPMRAVVVVNSPDVPEGEMEERMLDCVQTFDEVDQFFDKFDEEVAVPNESHIKYEVGSDGLVVIIVDLRKLKDTVLAFIDKFAAEVGDNARDDPEEAAPKRAKK